MLRGDGSLTRSWLLRFKYRGEESRILLGHLPMMSLAAARQAANELRERASQGIDPRRATARKPISTTDRALPAASGFTVAALVDEFLHHHVRPRLKRPEQVEQRLQRNVMPKWGHRDARTITPREVIELTDEIVARGSPREANKTAALLSQLFKFGIHRAIVETSPVMLLYRPGGNEPPRDRALSDEELRVILSNPTRALRLQRTAHALLVLLATGARRGELVLAKWSEVDTVKRLWRIPVENSKNGSAHDFPLSNFAIEHFNALRRLSARSRFVMPAAEGDAPMDPKLLTRSVARCARRLARLGVAYFTPHDIRRTVRTGLARLGVRPDIAERVVNHRPEKIIATYDVHQYMDERRDALERWAAHLQALMVRS